MNECAEDGWRCISLHLFNDFTGNVNSIHGNIFKISINKHENWAILELKWWKIPIGFCIYLFYFVGDEQYDSTHKIQQIKSDMCLYCVMLCVVCLVSNFNCIPELQWKKNVYQNICCQQAKHIRKLNSLVFFSFLIENLLACLMNLYHPYSYNVFGFRNTLFYWYLLWEKDGTMEKKMKSYFLCYLFHVHPIDRLFVCIVANVKLSSKPEWMDWMSSLSLKRNFFSVFEKFTLFA